MTIGATNLPSSVESQSSSFSVISGNRPPPYNRIDDNTAFSPSPAINAPVHQTLWHRIEHQLIPNLASIPQYVAGQIGRQSGHLAMAFQNSATPRLAAGTALGAIGTVSIFHHMGYHQRIDTLMAAVFGGMSAGAAVGLIGSVVVPSIYNFCALRRIDHEANSVELEHLNHGDNAV